MQPSRWVVSGRGHVRRIAGRLYTNREVRAIRGGCMTTWTELAFHVLDPVRRAIWSAVVCQGIFRQVAVPQQSIVEIDRG